MVERHSRRFPVLTSGILGACLSLVAIGWSPIPVAAAAATGSARAHASSCSSLAAAVLPVARLGNNYVIVQSGYHGYRRLPGRNQNAGSLAGASPTAVYRRHGYVGSYRLVLALNMVPATLSGTLVRIEVDQYRSDGGAFWGFFQSFERPEGRRGADFALGDQGLLVQGGGSNKRYATVEFRRGAYVAVVSVSGSALARPAALRTPAIRLDEGLAACGGTPLREARAVLDGFSTALVHRDVSRVRSFLSPRYFRACDRYLGMTTTYLRCLLDGTPLPVRYQIGYISPATAGSKELIATVTYYFHPPGRRGIRYQPFYLNLLPGPHGLWIDSGGLPRG